MQARQFDVFRTACGTLVVVTQSDLQPQFELTISEAVTLVPQLAATLTLAELGLLSGGMTKRNLGCGISLVRQPTDAFGKRPGRGV